MGAAHRAHVLAAAPCHPKFAGIQAQAIVFDPTLAIRPEERAARWNETNPYGMRLSAAPASAPDPDAQGEGWQFGRRFGSLCLARYGSFRYIPSWAYSLPVAPLDAVLHSLTLGAAEYQAFDAVPELPLFTL